MSQPCTYKFGEFSPEEFSSDEFFIGYKDCSVSSTDINCDNLFLYSKPYQSSQWEIDYNLLWDYVKSDLLTNSTLIMNKVEIGLIPELELDFGKQTKYLIDFLLLFKEQLKQDATIDNYILLFKVYKLDCINKHFTNVFSKRKYLKDMLTLLNINGLINFTNDTRYISSYDSLNLDPIYYIANI